MYNKHLILKHRTIYTLNNIATPAKIHFDGFCRVFRLNVHTYVGPLCLILYTGHSYMFRKSCLSLMMALTCTTGIIGNNSFKMESTIQPMVKSQRAPSNINPLIIAPSLGAILYNHTKHLNTIYLILYTFHRRNHKLHNKINVYLVL